MTVVPEDFKEFFELLEDQYDHNYESFSRYLYEAIFSLQYVSDHDTSRGDVLEITFTLYQLEACFYKAIKSQRARDPEASDW